MQHGHRQAQRCFQAGDAVGRAFEFLLLFVSRMGRVIGGNRVNGALDDALKHRLTVGLGAQGRIHLGMRVVFGDCLFV